jgi:hypothetical protein
MATEEWTVHAKLTGEFYISDERRSSKAPLVEGLRQLRLSHEFNDDGKWTGLHELEAVLSLENKGGTPLESRVVYERAKILVDSITALATLGIGRPVLVSGGVSVKRRLTDDPPKYRFITCATQTASIAPPAPLPAELLATSIDPRIQRVIRWLARGLATSDAVDRLVALNNALDLLAGMVDGAPARVRQCKSCGAEEAIGPGLRERVVYFLTGVLGYTHAVATDVYESRLDLAHARSNLEEDDLRRYRGHATLVAAAVRTGIARALAVTLPPIPEPLPLDLPSALLDIEYVEGEMAQASPNELE